MVRWLLVGSLLVGMGLGFRHGWLELHWDRLAEDLHLPALADPQAPLRGLLDPDPATGPTPQESRSSSSRQAR